MRDTEVLSALFETTRTLGIDHDLDSLLGLILERARDLTGFDNCALMLVDTDAGDLVVRAVLGYGDDREQVEGLRLGGGQGLTGWAMKHRRPARVGDVREDPRYVQGLAEARSNLAVPLILENEVVGVLNVESRQVDAFDERDEKVLTVLGTQAALAILAARARTDLQGRIDQLDALYQISGLTWMDKTLVELAQAVVGETARVVPSASSALLLVDATGERLQLIAHVGYTDSVEGLELTVQSGITGRCVRSGEIQIVDDVRSDPDYVPGVDGARCEVALPLEVHGRIIGVLDVESRRIQSIAPDQVRTLTMIAKQIAAVLEAARLQEERLHQAYTDALTGLANRRLFDERLDTAWQATRRGDQPLSLLLLDLDNFKQINDGHGHAVGDRVLARVAESLQGVVRQDDLLARVGGEELAVVARGAGVEPARGLAERLRNAVEELVVHTECGKQLRVTASVGVAGRTPEMDGPTELYELADRALYRAKQAGRNRVEAAD